MKRVYLIAISFIIPTLFAQAQQDIEGLNPPCQSPDYINGKEIYDIVEYMPTFPGGVDSLKLFIAENFHKPEGLDPSIKVIYLRMIIDEHGNCLYPCILTRDKLKITEELEKAVLDFVAIMPQWNPGIHRKIPQNVRFSFPIRFE